MKQLPEVWRRGVVVPLTSEAAIEMAQFLVTHETDAMYLPIETDSFFYDLWATDLFQDINRSCCALIDDYEEEALPPEVLSSGLRVIVGHRSRARNQQVSDFLKDLEELFRKAIELTFPVYFIL